MPENEETDYDELYNVRSSDKVPYAISLAKQIDRVNLSKDVYDEQRQLDRFEAMLYSRVDDEHKEAMKLLREDINKYKNKISKGSSKQIESRDAHRILMWENKQRYRMLVCLMDRAGFLPLKEGEWSED